MAKYVLISALLVAVFCCCTDATPLSLFGKLAKRANGDKCDQTYRDDLIAMCQEDYSFRKEDCENGYKETCQHKICTKDDCEKALIKAQASEVCKDNYPETCKDDYFALYRKCRLQYQFNNDECNDGFRTCRNKKLRGEECVKYLIKEQASEVCTLYGKKSCKDDYYEIYTKCRLDYLVSNDECNEGFFKCLKKTFRGQQCVNYLLEEQDSISEEDSDFEFKRMMTMIKRLLK